jgi:transcriptional regulator with XRE-family HTH domain
MNFRQAPSVSIDGETIRNIRETKRLTQLYVSKVVGVTTDTVSRWENNRYPTIRRDNALKLAEALEVGFDEILKQDDAVEEAIFESEEEPKKWRWPLALIFILILLGAVGIFWQKRAVPPPVLLAERLLPPNAPPGGWVLIRVRLSSERSLKGMILKEEFPQGWKLVESDPPASSLDNLEGVARWIFRHPELETSVSYRLEVAKNAVVGTQVPLRGELIANPDGQRYALPVQAVGMMTVTPLHWADQNGNQIIDDLEILEVSGLLDEIGQLHLDWDLLEKIWDTGGYRWDPASNQFVPEHPEDQPTADQN